MRRNHGKGLLIIRPHIRNPACSLTNKMGLIRNITAHMTGPNSAFFICLLRRKMTVCSHGPDILFPQTEKKTSHNCGLRSLVRKFSILRERHYRTPTQKKNKIVYLLHDGPVLRDVLVLPRRSIHLSQSVPPPGAHGLTGGQVALDYK